MNRLNGLIRTSELEQVARSAALPVCLVTVRTLTLDRVKDETTGTRDRVGMAVHTEVELVANRFVRVSKITMLTRTTRSRLGRLQLVPAVAVDGKGKAATCAIIYSFVKDKSVRAEVFRDHSLVTLIISITLECVSEEPIFFRTLRNVVLAKGEDWKKKK